MPEKPETYLDSHIENWKKKRAGNKGKTTAWDFKLDASGRPLYDHNGKLSKHKRQGPIKAKTGWDPLK